MNSRALDTGRILITTCVAQVFESDQLDFVAGTFVWSGFDYLGEARGWPQNTKCRGTVSDVASWGSLPVINEHWHSYTLG